ncbi:MAG: hypothetical protein GX086_05170 [Alcaligenaceae bacterium]|nr:hypothetical protein [Alcaligenaceae bacterium]
MPLVYFFDLTLFKEIREVISFGISRNTNRAKQRWQQDRVVRATGHDSLQQLAGHLQKTGIKKPPRSL